MLTRWIRGSVARAFFTALLGFGVAGATLAFPLGSAEAKRRAPVHLSKDAKAGKVVKIRHAREGRTTRRVARVVQPAGGGDMRSNPLFSAVVIDVKAGRTLYDAQADGQRHPASVTKVMTLYMLFDQLASGRMTLDTQMPVSAHAAMQAPTKLGLQPGSTLRVEDAIKGMVTRSANDAAVVVAEAIGGTESNFAAMMTRKARSLGMSRTVYRNASGLPDPGQLTSARDLAVLGVAIQDRFPTYYRYFSTRTFVFRGRDIANHNRLLGSVEGVDGIKTGYTRASGFNLLTSIRKDGRQLVAVVMGGRTGGSRDATMRQLIASYLPRAYAGTRQNQPAYAAAEAPVRMARAEIPDAGAEPMTDAAPEPEDQVVHAPVVQAPVVQAPPPPAAPRIRPAVVAETPKPKANAPAAIRVASATLPAPLQAPVQKPIGTARPAIASTAEAGPLLRWVQGPAPVATAPATRPARTAEGATVSTDATSMVQLVRTKTFTVADLAEDASHMDDTATLADPAPAPDPAPSKAAAAPRDAEPATGRTGWIIQIGATDSKVAARKLLDKAVSTGHRALASAEPFTESVERNGSTLWRARFAGFDDQRKAQAACAALKSREFACMAARL